jgi:hypothetical protein
MPSPAVPVVYVLQGDQWVRTAATGVVGATYAPGGWQTRITTGNADSFFPADYSRYPLTITNGTTSLTIPGVTSFVSVP